MLGAALILAALLPVTGDAPPPRRRALPPVTVSAAPSRADDPGSPASRSVLDADVIARAGPQVDVTEALARVPGLIANNRWNYAQDLQLAIRGYGARASFGVRGIKLYVNGVPASAPDGQGQLAHVALGGIGRIEVIRGPLAALYGNAAGGVIKLDADPWARRPPRRAAGALSDDGERIAAGWHGSDGDGAFAVDASRFASDGFRPHSAARRRVLDAVGERDVGDGWRVSVTLNHLDVPEAEDPLGLTPADFARDPTATAAPALAFDTRKSVRQSQFGAALLRDDGDAAPALRLAAYGGARRVEQYLALPVAAQANPLSGGGVVDLARDFAGLELRASGSMGLGRGLLTLVAGLDVDRVDEDRRGYENFVGGTLGVRGRLRRDESNTVEATALLLEARWQPAPRWRIVAGLRPGRVRFASDDRFVSATNPDDGGRRVFRATVPALGLSYAASEAVTLTASAARGFETPTVAELAFRADGTAGLNFALEPARSLRRELGLAWRAPRLRADLALFRDDTDDEIAIARNVGGRAAFQNAGRTRRRGAELGLGATLAPGLRGSLAWTWIDARYAGAACAGVRCARLRPSFDAGNRLPAVPARFGFAELDWRPTRRWRFGLETRVVDAVFADDANRLRAPGHVLLGARVTRRLPLAAGRLEATLRVDNLADRVHVASVIVNEASGRVFEPGRGRSTTLVLDYRW